MSRVDLSSTVVVAVVLSVLLRITLSSPSAGSTISEISTLDKKRNKNNSNNNTNNCTLDFILTSCKPYKTFQTCHQGKCICPTNFQPSLLKDDLVINTYWDGTHRQCVSKLNSVCFYLPPSILVSQPYRCVIPDAECSQAPGQFNGVGICKCKETGGCKNSGTGSGEGSAGPGSGSDNNVYIVGTKSENPDSDDANSGNPGSSYSNSNSIKSAAKNTRYTLQSDECLWKFQCPHLQECISGQCACPSQKQHRNGYWQNMIWDDEDKICLSLAGSYCNNAKFQKPHEDMLIKTILSSMMEVRCAPGLTCEDSHGFEIGICSSSIQIMGQDRLLALFYLLVFIIMY